MFEDSTISGEFVKNWKREYVKLTELPFGLFVNYCLILL